MPLPAVVELLFNPLILYRQHITSISLLHNALHCVIHNCGIILSQQSIAIIILYILTVFNFQLGKYLLINCNSVYRAHSHCKKQCYRSHAHTENLISILWLKRYNILSRSIHISVNRLIQISRP